MTLHWLLYAFNLLGWTSVHVKGTASPKVAPVILAPPQPNAPQPPAIPTPASLNPFGRPNKYSTLKSEPGHEPVRQPTPTSQ